MRYDFLIKLIELIKPETIVEIGVHKGIRAESMCRQALRYKKNVTYTGYDLWELLVDHKLVSNGKGPSTRAEVDKKLNLLKQKNKSFNYELVQGDTEHTVSLDTRADLVFIDADHRDWAIQRDYLRCKNSRFCVLDDVYDPPIAGLGANDLIVDPDTMVKVLQSQDRVKQSNTRINLLVVSKDPIIQSLGLKDR